MARKAICVHVHMSDNRETLCENSWLPLDVDNMETLCDDKIGFAHVHVSDSNVKAITGKRCVTLKIVGCLSMSTIRRRCVTMTAVCVHDHVNDTSGTLCDAEYSWLPVYVDNRETLCDDNSGLRACSHERYQAKVVYL